MPAESTAAINLLLVEDNPGDARLLQLALRKAGTAHTVTHSEDLQAALHHIAAARFDVILLDLSLPDCCGLETLTRVQSQASDTPIVVLTGNNDETLGVNALQAGAEDYLVKGSVDGALLTRAMRYAIERHRILTQLKEFDRLKSEFLATASHELRTPLTIIREFVSLVNDEVVGPVTPDQKECLSDALRNCDRLTVLLNDLLDMSKLKSTNIELRRQKIDIADLLTVCYRDFAQKCRTKNIDLRLEAPETLPFVVCDSDRISQALVNLLGNAYKFTPEGGKIILRAEACQNFVTLEIEDSGKGISKQDQALIFDAFTQVDRQEGPGAKGTGLGLAITQRIVELHGGVISVESEPGQGSRFRFRLPIYEAKTFLMACLEDLYHGSQSSKTVSLALLRVKRASGEQESELWPLWRPMSEHLQYHLRPGDKMLLLEAEQSLALLMESDAAGSFTALKRLVQTLPEDMRTDVRFEAAVSQAIPNGPLTEWAHNIQQQFAPID